MAGVLYFWEDLDQSQNVHQDRLRITLLCQESELLSPQERPQRWEVLQKTEIGNYSFIQAKLKWLKNIYVKAKQQPEAELIDQIEKAEEAGEGRELAKNINHDKDLV